MNSEENYKKYGYESEEEAWKDVLRWVLEIWTILEEILETAQIEPEQKESIMQKQKTPKELRAEIEKQLLDLNLVQLVKVARFIGITEEEIAADIRAAMIGARV